MFSITVKTQTIVGRYYL